MKNLFKGVVAVVSLAVMLALVAPAMAGPQPSKGTKFGVIGQEKPATVLCDARMESCKM